MAHRSCSFHLRGTPDVPGHIAPQKSSPCRQLVGFGLKMRTLTPRRSDHPTDPAVQFLSGVHTRQPGSVGTTIRARDVRFGGPSLNARHSAGKIVVATGQLQLASDALQSEQDRVPPHSPRSSVCRHADDVVSSALLRRYHDARRRRPRRWTRMLQVQSTGRTPERRVRTENGRCQIEGAATPADCALNEPAVQRRRQAAVRGHGTAYRCLCESPQGAMSVGESP